MTTNVGKLGVVVSGSTKELQAELKETERLVKRGKAVYESVRTPLEQYQHELKDLQALLRKGAIDQETFNRAVTKSQSAAGMGGKSPLAGVGNVAAGAVPGLSSLASTFTALGPAAAVALVGIGALKLGLEGFKFVAGQVVASFERIGQLADEADRLGVSAQSLAGLQFAGQLAGFEGVTGLLEKLQVNLGEAATEGGKTDAALKRLGLSSQALANMPVDQAARKIAAELREFGNASERAALTTDIFGKVGAKALGFLLSDFEEAERKARAFGVALSDTDVAQIDAAGDSVATLKSMMHGAANVAADELAPAIQAVADSLIGMGSGEVNTSAQFVRDYIHAAKEDVATLLSLAKLRVDPVGGMRDLMTGDTAGQAMLDWEAKAQKISQDSAAIQLKAAKADQARVAAAKELLEITELTDKISKEAKEVGKGESDKFQMEIDRLRKAGGDTSEAEAALKALRDAEQTEKDKKEADKAEKDHARQVEQDANAVKNMVAQLKEQNIELKDGAAALQAYKLQALGAGEIEIAWAETLRKRNEKLKEDEATKKEDEARLKQLIEAAKTPEQKLQEEAAFLWQQFTKGEIDPATHSTLMNKAKADLLKTEKPFETQLAAAEKGSAAAFSTINRSRMGSGPNRLEALARDQVELARDGNQHLAVIATKIGATAFTIVESV